MTNDKVATAWSWTQKEENYVLKLTTSEDSDPQKRSEINNFRRIWLPNTEPFQISAFLPDCHCPKELDVARVGMD